MQHQLAQRTTVLQFRETKKWHKPAEPSGPMLDVNVINDQEKVHEFIRTRTLLPSSCKNVLRTD